MVEYLMDEEIGTLAIRIIRNHNTVSLTAMNLFQNLKCFGTGGSAHVQHDAIGLHIQEHRRKHTDSLLATNVAGQVQGNHVFVKLLESLDLAELLTMNIDLSLRMMPQRTTCQAPSSSYHLMGCTQGTCCPSYSTVPSKWYFVFKLFLMIS